MREKGRQDATPEELVNEPIANEFSDEDREFVRDELAWLADWIRSKHPKLNFADVRRLLLEMVPLSV